MKPKDLVGKTFTVVDASAYRMLLESDNGMDIETNKFILVVAESVGDGADGAIFDYTEMKK